MAGDLMSQTFYCVEWCPLANDNERIDQYDNSDKYSSVRVVRKRH